MLRPGGATKYDARKPLIDNAAAAGVKLFFASKFASDIVSPHFAKFLPLFVGDKIRARGYLEKRVGRGEIAWTAPNGGPFFDMCEFCCVLSFYFFCLERSWLVGWCGEDCKLMSE